MFDHLSGDTSAPFCAGENGQVAVKVLDARGNELVAVTAICEVSSSGAAAGSRKQYDDASGGTLNGYCHWRVSMIWQDHISVDPLVCHGQACIRGTRIPVTVLLANLAAGHSVDALRRSYPGLTEDSVRAALAYAADLAAERVIALPTDPAGRAA